MQYQQGNESLKQKNGITCREKVIISYGTFWISRKRNFKKKFFLIGLRSCPNQTKRGLEYHQCNESAKKKVIGIACPGKKWVFMRNFANFANCEFLRILKIIPFHRVKELSKSNQTRYLVSSVYWECKAKKMVQLASEKIGFSYGILQIWLIASYWEFLKKFFFIGSRSCPNQTKLGMQYHQCNESVKQKNWYTLSGKKLVFHTELFEFLEKGIFKKGLFHRVKELSKSNQTRCGVSPV